MDRWGGKKNFAEYIAADFRLELIESTSFAQSKAGTIECANIRGIDCVGKRVRLKIKVSNLRSLNGSKEKMTEYLAAKETLEKMTIEAIESFALVQPKPEAPGVNTTVFRIRCSGDPSSKEYMKWQVSLMKNGDDKLKEWQEKERVRKEEEKERKQVGEPVVVVHVVASVVDRPGKLSETPRGLSAPSASAPSPTPAPSPVQALAPSPSQVFTLSSVQALSPAPTPAPASTPASAPASTRDSTPAPVQAFSPAPTPAPASTRASAPAPVQALSSFPVQVLSSASSQGLSPSPVQGLSPAPTPAPASTPAPTLAPIHSVQDPTPAHQPLLPVSTHPLQPRPLAPASSTSLPFPGSLDAYLPLADPSSRPFDSFVPSLSGTGSGSGAGVANALAPLMNGDYALESSWGPSVEDLQAENATLKAKLAAIEANSKDRRAEAAWNKEFVKDYLHNFKTMSNTLIDDTIKALDSGTRQISDRKRRRSSSSAASNDDDAEAVVEAVQVTVGPPPGSD